MFKQVLVALLLSSVSLVGVQAAVDPTRPPSVRYSVDPAAKKAVKPLKLQSIRISEAGRWAVINGKRVGEGERIQGAKVTSISPGKVKLQRAGQQRVLTLGSTAKIKRYSQENR